MIAKIFDGREKTNAQNNPRTNMGLVYESIGSVVLERFDKNVFHSCAPYGQKNGETDRQPDILKKKVTQDTHRTNTDIVCEFQLSRYSSFLA